MNIIIDNNKYAIIDDNPDHIDPYVAVCNKDWNAYYFSDIKLGKLVKGNHSRTIFEKHLRNLQKVVEKYKKLKLLL